MHPLAQKTSAFQRPPANLFRAMIGGTIRAEDIDLHFRQSYGTEIQSREIENPNMLMPISELNRELIGIAQLRGSVPPACLTPIASGAVQQLYVRERWHGKGVGQALMFACKEARYS